MSSPGIDIIVENAASSNLLLGNNISDFILRLTFTVFVSFFLFCRFCFVVVSAHITSQYTSDLWMHAATKTKQKKHDYPYIAIVPNTHKMGAAMNPKPAAKRRESEMS